MKLFMVKKVHLLILLLLAVACYALQQPVHASKFGSGLFGEDVPFGSATSIAVSLSGDPNIITTYGGGNFSGSASHTVTVTSTDVVGYKLYANSTSTTTMSNGTDTIAASANGSPSTLATNSWGYNTTGSSSNFTGMTLSQVQIKDAIGPYKNGDNTTVTYGVLVDTSKSSGTYTNNVTYTAIGQD